MYTHTQNETYIILCVCVCVCVCACMCTKLTYAQTLFGRNIVYSYWKKLFGRKYFLGQFSEVDWSR